MRRKKKGAFDSENESIKRETNELISGDVWEKGTGGGTADSEHAFSECMRGRPHSRRSHCHCWGEERVDHLYRGGVYSLLGVRVWEKVGVRVRVRVFSRSRAEGQGLQG